ncbi:ATP-dependent sacrificial sulfur transferase LarE [Lujinxingia vulgaris]|uniref:ATP-dependent sacrificial sulfur transferase LarE n=1 Tax=Lujinxingia vulgaris TaxID=2600176 RepID=A0A5C6X8J5_9DELT|nr:ATP-dependent sacrificial sulfur transferase LarE [Lujinxingia vulgaris]TXD35463.1 ATP-dependent sacrificial sulfur transferase LarE [Lujinxingia vulgaris]
MREKTAEIKGEGRLSVGEGRLSVGEVLEVIEEEMRQVGKLVVAFSGGVDSAVVAAIAQRALGEQAWAVTAVSETLAGRELEEACALAEEIGIRHELIEFSELDDARFRENTSARCFFCQSMRFDQIATIAASLDCDVLASGTNASDVGDHRPGLEAMAARKVYQPLLKHGVTKDQVRELARELGLSVWDKPAMACLSSRIPHGLEVTRERLRRVERAEEVLHRLGFKQFRVRAHGELARVEVAVDEMARVLEPRVLGEVARGVKAAGFDDVTLDLTGFRSGSLNPVRSNDSVKEQDGE